MIVYKITNIKNGKIYIGKTIKQLQVRWKMHIKHAMIEHRQTKFCNAIRKHGVESFSIETLCTCNTIEELNEREIEIIAEYQATDPNKGYNISTGGDGGKRSQEHYVKIADIRRGKTYEEIFGDRSIEVKQKQLQGLRAYFDSEEYVPRVHTEETKQKLSDIGKAAWLNDDFRKAGIERAKIRGEKMRGDNHRFYGKHHSQDTRNAMSKNRTGKTYEEIFGIDKAFELKQRRQYKFSKNNPKKKTIDMEIILTKLIENPLIQMQYLCKTIPCGPTTLSKRIKQCIPEIENMCVFRRIYQIQYQRIIYQKALIKLREDSTMRKLATIRMITDIKPINNADNIELVFVDGWSIITKKNEFAKNELVIYLEVDSCLPVASPLFAFLSARGVKEIAGVMYHRLKTIKMRGVYSQGLIVKLSQLDFDVDPSNTEMDYAEFLGIIKWDPELYSPSTVLAGNALRSFPSHMVPKTDEERVQNMSWVLNSTLSFEETLKLDGSSFTAYYNAKDEHPFGVCSRNLQLKHEDEANAENAFIKIAKKFNIQEKLANCGMNVAIQGEAIGPGIQGNKEKLSELDLYVFNAYDIDNQREMLPTERRKFVEQLGLKHVPVLNENVIPSQSFSSMADILQYADGPSMNNNLREGIVFKCNQYDPNTKEVLSFKVISNKFLLKNGDD